MASSEGARDRKAVVVGCGPAGAMMAVCLARLGWRVEVHEAMPAFDRRSTEANRSGQRNYDLMLRTRGLKSLQAVGLELGPEQAIKTNTVRLHSKTPGKFQEGPIGEDGLEMVSRDSLADALRAHGAKSYPQLISHEFEHKLMAIDFEGKVATFETADGRTEKRPYDLLVGADGVWSKTRAAMVERGMLTFEQEFNKGCNKQLDLAKISDVPGADESWATVWHIWICGSPRIAVVGTPRPDGGLHLALGDTASDIRKGEIDLANLKTEADVEELFKTKFPDIFMGQPLPEGLVSDLLEQRPGHNGITTYCSAFHGGDGVVLVGDAAHSVYPNQGQGCNVGLESCIVLAELIAKHGGDLTAALPAFTAERKPEMDAVAELSKRQIFTPLYLAKWVLLRWLHRALPFAFKVPAQDRIGRLNTSFVEVAKQARWENRKLQLLALGVAATGFLLAQKR